MTELVEKMNALVSGDEWPRLITASSHENNISLSFELAEGISWFAGHFPDQPVLPGVVQIHWAAKIAQTVFSNLLSEGGRFTLMNNIKFKTMLLPGQIVNLDLKYNAVKHSVTFSYYADENIFSTGTLVFAAP